MPTFNILIATIGRPTLQRMLNSLSPQLEKDDCLTIVYDGHSEIPKFNLDNFKCKVICYCEPEALGFWGHGIRNKYASLLEIRDFVMHADDDDVYRKDIFDKLRLECNDTKKFYVAKIAFQFMIIPVENIIIEGNISTQNGIIPFDLNKKGHWEERCGGDGAFYIQLSEISKPAFLNIVIYIVRPTNIKPTFNVLIATIGRPTLQRMLNSLSPQLEKDDCLTIVYDGHSEIPKFNLDNFKCKVICYCEPEALGFWGHGIRNKYASLLEIRDFVMHADDDDIYQKDIFNKLRLECNDVDKLYIVKVAQPNIITPLDNTITEGFIGTANGIIPFYLNKKGVWEERYGGDGAFYTQLSKITDPIFLNIIAYIVRP